MSDLPATVPERITGRVAGVLNARELVINIGSEASVQVGMRFSVLAAEATEILDPETNERLGLLDREKVRVEVTEVRPRFSVCSTFGSRGGSVGALSGWAALFSQSLYSTLPKPITLRAEDSSMLPPLSEEASYVKTGDRVVQVREVTSNS